MQMCVAPSQWFLGVPKLSSTPSASRGQAGRWSTTAEQSEACMGSGMDRWSSTFFPISLVMWYTECNWYVNQKTRSLLCSRWEPCVPLPHSGAPPAGHSDISGAGREDAWLHPLNWGVTSSQAFFVFDNLVSFEEYWSGNFLEFPAIEIFLIFSYVRKKHKS